MKFVVIVSVISVRLLMEKFKNIIIVKVLISDSGMVMLGIIVVGILCKNR